MDEKGHLIKSVLKKSIAKELNVESGDRLVSINGNEIVDVFDYQYLIQDEYIEVMIKKASGEEWLLEINKDYEEDFGVEFENGLMDDYRSCHNKCIFCFIDQMPKGMRETLYFKDDDTRLSFLQGNYVTLTNMSEYDMSRIVKYHLSPINISFQTTNPELRCKMMNNRFAGEALKKVDVLYEAGILMNGQIVLCKGVNDGKELERSIKDLTKYIKNLESVSVVPVGLSKYREGLYPLEPFTKQDARNVLEIIHKWQEKCYNEYETHFIHASDEWYILAEYDLPEEGRYDGYLQLENGVGMVRLLLDEFAEALQTLENDKKQLKKLNKHPKKVSLVTGMLVSKYIQLMVSKILELVPTWEITVFPIKNYFFGENITVSGLLTGQDIKNALIAEELGDKVLLPQNVLRSGEKVFLDDMTITDLENALQVPVDIVKSSGQEFIRTVLFR